MADTTIKFTEEGRGILLPLLREYREVIGRDLTKEELIAFLNGWKAADRCAASAAMTNTPYPWLSRLVVETPNVSGG